MATEHGKVLVVDDSEEMRFLICTLLRTMGQTSIEAKDGIEALKILDQDLKIRMVITDFEMPGMNGLELTRRIRCDSRLEDLPVLMHTAAPFDEMWIRADLAGVTRLLPKTLNPGTLRDEVERILHDIGPDHVWRALLVGVPQDSATTIRSALSESGFQVLQVSDEEQAREVLKSVENIDLAFVSRPLPESNRFVLVHRLRTPQDFNLFRLVMLMGGIFADEADKAGPVCVAGHLLEPVNHAHVNGILRRLGLECVRGQRC